jgi:carbon-monoxide dehydrogenase medium subunit
MVALDGHIVARGPKGTRTIKVREFVTGPFQNVLDYDEIAIEAVVPAPTGVAHGGYLKLERRVGDFATAAVAVAVDISGGTVRRAGVALTGVGSTTVHAVEAGEALVGSALSEATIQRAAEAAAAAAKPRTDHRGSASYKRHIINTFTARVLRGIAESTEKAA